MPELETPQNPTESRTGTASSPDESDSGRADMEITVPQYRRVLLSQKTPSVGSDLEARSGTRHLGFLRQQRKRCCRLDCPPRTGCGRHHFGDLPGKEIVDGAKPKQTVLLIAPDDLPVLQASKSVSGGGGGGGDRDKLQASPGRLPQQSRQQIVPPAAVIRNQDPKLPMDPTIVAPDLHLTSAAPDLGDPLVASSIGRFEWNGIRRRHRIRKRWGRWLWRRPRIWARTRRRHRRRSVSAWAAVFRRRRLIYSPDPEYSEEARKAKFQGTCVLWLVVGPDGRPRDIKVARTLGLGLDEKAIEP